MLSFQLEKIINTNVTVIEYFTNPNDALENFDELVKYNIDVYLVIVDFQMPQMNGAQLIRQLKEKKSDLICVMLSGQANTVQVMDLQKDNMLNAFINKPWDEYTLFETIKPFLSKNSILCEK
jgi:FixJ family two-component response regulator